MLKAILSGIDTHPANSIALMLRSIGYEVFMLHDDALRTLKDRGYTGGVTRNELDSMGYSNVTMPFVGMDALNDCDLFVDLKTAYIDSFKTLYPDMPVVHFLINGGMDDYVNCGFHYPVVTANMWVEGEAFRTWLPFDNVHNLQPREQRTDFTAPIGLLHSPQGWGFGHILDDVILRTGVKIYGLRAPEGIIQNAQLAKYFETTVGMLHLKSNDCPGYALYEAMEAGVPLILCEQMLDRMKMRELYEDGETCVLWGGDFYDKKYCQETGLTKEWFKDNHDAVIDDIIQAIERVKDPAFNYKIGQGGHKRFKKLTEWTPEKIKSFAAFFKKNKLPCSLNTKEKNSTQNTPDTLEA